jgi:hypothetical protein
VTGGSPEEVEMGAAQFCGFARGEKLQDAFRSAAEAARYEHGHGGYTGTIAEKHDCHVVSPAPTPEGVARALRHAAACIRRGEPCSAADRDDIRQMQAAGKNPLGEDWGDGGLEGNAARLERKAAKLDALVGKPFDATVAEVLAYALMEVDLTYCDKHGPAHAFEVPPGPNAAPGTKTWCIFGWAPE